MCQICHVQETSGREVGGEDNPVGTMEISSTWSVRLENPKFDKSEAHIVRNVGKQHVDR